MKHLLCVLTLLVACPVIALAQSAFRPTEQQKIDLVLSQFQQGIQQTTPERVKCIGIDSTLLVDGKASNAGKVAEFVRTMATRMPNRGVYAANPLPDVLGPLWDFQIVEQTREMGTDSCHVDFQYVLIANGEAVGQGRMDLVKFGFGWRAVRLDGLSDFLNAELARFQSLNQPPKGSKK